VLRYAVFPRASTSGGPARTARDATVEPARPLDAARDTSLLERTLQARSPLLDLAGRVVVRALQARFQLCDAPLRVRTGLAQGLLEVGEAKRLARDTTALLRALAFDAHLPSRDRRIQIGERALEQLDAQRAIRGLALRDASSSRSARTCKPEVAIGSAAGVGCSS
jgi:hypothetical protein